MTAPWHAALLTSAATALVAPAGLAAAAPAESVRFSSIVTLAKRIVVARGRFSVAGAITDTGRIVDQVKNVRGDLHIIRKLTGKKGAVRMRVRATVSTDGRMQCRWRILSATRSYARLRRRGTCWGRMNVRRIRLVMGGGISR